MDLEIERTDQFSKMAYLHLVSQLDYIYWLQRLTILITNLNCNDTCMKWPRPKPPPYPWTLTQNNSSNLMQGTGLQHVEVLL